MASSPNIIHSGGGLQLPPWRLGTGFCLGVSLWGQPPVEKTHVLTGKHAEPCVMMFELERQMGLTGMVSAALLKSCGRLWPLIMYCCITHDPQMSKLIIPVFLLKICDKLSWAIFLACSLFGDGGQNVSQGHSPLTWLDGGWQPTKMVPHKDDKVMLALSQRPQLHVRIARRLGVLPNMMPGFAQQEV